MPGRGSLKTAVVMTCADRQAGSSMLLYLAMLCLIATAWSLHAVHAALLTSLQQDANGQDNAGIGQPASHLPQY